MSLVDDVFGSIPGPLIDQWGIDGVYVKKVENAPYDPTTGTSPIQTLADVRSISLTLSDHPVIIEIQH